MAYLNHAGTSWPKPEPVLRAAASAQRADPADFGAAFATHHGQVAAALGVPDPARLLLTPGCTSALAVGIADHSWEAGDRVLCSGWEHHGLHRQLVLLEGRGVRVEQVPDPANAESLEAALSPGSAGGSVRPVRLVAMTAACNVTGELLPIAEVIAAAHRHGALVLVDAAQVAGWIDLSEVAPGADLVAFAGHKGPQAPWGIGGLIAAEGVELASPGATCELPQPGQAPICGTMPGYCDVGSVDRSALAGLAAGLAWLAEPERADHLRVARELIERLVVAALGLGGVQLHGPREAELRMPTAAFTFDGREPGALARALAERGVHAAAGLQCAPLAHRTLGTAPAGVLRFSAGPTTTEADIEAAVAGLRAVLAGA